MSGSSTSFTIDTGAYGIQEGRQPPSTGAPEPSPSVIKHRVIHLFVPPTLEVNAVAAVRIPLVSPMGVKSLLIAYPLKMEALRQWKLEGGSHKVRALFPPSKLRIKSPHYRAPPAAARLPPGSL